MVRSVIGGRYHVNKVIGDGGMATVYHAIDQTLGRDVAVKVLHQHMVKNENIRQRFVQEAQAISQLDHPNIVQIFDFSGENSQSLWLVMEYIDGWNLAQFLLQFSEKHLHPIVGCCIVKEICKALVKAHGMGMIHRDIKPENIMITKDGHIKLTDFGIVKNIRSDNKTQTGTFMGSPSYMSTEQIKGKDIDERSDTYSLSILFYEIVTGFLPFRGGSTHDVALAIVEGKPKSPMSLNPNIPPEVDQIIFKGIQKDPLHRYQTAQELGFVIDQYLKSLGLVDTTAELENFFLDKDQYALQLSKLKILDKTKHIQNLANTVQIQRDELSAIDSKITQVVAQKPEPMFRLAPPVANVAPLPISTPQREAAAHVSRAANDYVSPPPMAPVPTPMAANGSPRTRRKSRPSPRPNMERVHIKVISAGKSKNSGILSFLLVSVAIFLIVITATVIGRKVASQTTFPISFFDKKSEEKTNTLTKENVPMEDLKLDLPDVIHVSPSLNDETPLSRPEQPKRSTTPLKRPIDHQIKGPNIKMSTHLGAPLKVPQKDPAVQAPATLRVSSNPASQIFIDGKRVGTTNSQDSQSHWIPLAPGSYALELRRPLYHPYRETVSFDAGEKKTIAGISLKPLREDEASQEVYSLTVNTNKIPARITVKDLIRKNITFDSILNESQRIFKLRSGRYSIEIEHSGQVIKRSFSMPGGPSPAQTFHAEF